MGMKETIRRTAFLAAAAAMSNEVAEYFDTGRRHTHTERPYHRPADLPRWRVGDHILFAKNAADAEKYARKRGLWTEGCTVKPLKEE